MCGLTRTVNRLVPQKQNVLANLQRGTTDYGKERNSKMKYAGIREFAGRYFCGERCLQNYEWFHRNGENWMTIKENENKKQINEMAFLQRR